MTDRHELILTCPKGLEGLLLEEATQLGLEEPREQTAAVRGYGALDVAYRLCLWSRLANRVLLVLSRFSTTDAETLYQGCTQSIGRSTCCRPAASQWSSAGVARASTTRISVR